MQSIVAVMGLGIATGYLVSKNRVIKHQIDNAVAGYEGSAEPATDGVTSAEIRSTRKLTNHVKFGDFKESLPIKERDAVLAQQSAAAKAVDDFNGSAPSIQGILLQHDGLGV